MCRATVLFAAIAAMAFGVATAAADDTAKFQQAILDVRGCIMANEPAAEIADIHRLDDAYLFLRARCFTAFNEALSAKGETEAAPGAFRLIVRDEWREFQCHLGRC
jgi:hypothetical protein